MEGTIHENIYMLYAVWARITNKETKNKKKEEEGNRISKH